MLIGIPHGHKPPRRPRSPSSAGKSAWLRTRRSGVRLPRRSPITHLPPVGGQDGYASDCKSVPDRFDSGAHLQEWPGSSGVEHLTENQGVGGSRPPPATIQPQKAPDGGGATGALQGESIVRPRCEAEGSASQPPNRLGPRPGPSDHPPRGACSEKEKQMRRTFRARTVKRSLTLMRADR